MSDKVEEIVEDVVNTAQELIVLHLNQALTLLVDTCQKTSDGMGGEYIPMSMLKEYKEIIVKKYAEGLAENPSFKK